MRAINVCRALRAEAAELSRRPRKALKYLSTWGIECSEDVGGIVYALVDGGFFQLSENDSRRDFDGLFNSGELYTSSKLD